MKMLAERGSRCAKAVTRLFLCVLPFDCWTKSVRKMPTSGLGSSPGAYTTRGN